MSFETSVLNMSPITVPSVTPKGTAYLRIIPERDDRVRVERTPAGTKRLNAFWAVWLRQLVLQKTDVNDGLSVELRDNDVLFTIPTDSETNSSSTITPQGLIMTVMHLATPIVPIPGPPMYRRWEDKFEMTWWPQVNRRRRWEEFADYEALSHVLAGLQLPPQVRLHWDSYTIRLDRGKRCQFKMRHLAHMIEMNVALHYGLSYQYFPTPHYPRV